MNTHKHKTTQEFRDKQDAINDKIESMITEKNENSVYHLCVKHGFGIHMTKEKKQLRLLIA